MESKTNKLRADDRKKLEGAEITERTMLQRTLLYQWTAGPRSRMLRIWIMSKGDYDMPSVLFRTYLR